MRTQFLLTACVSSFLLLPSAFAQGSLTPPAGAPTATMRSLDQIYNRLDTRTPISSAPFTISASGSYYLTTNVTVSSGDAITVSANNVTLDLNGYTISSTAASANGSALLLNSVTNVSIHNGNISSGVIYYGVGVFSGGGFHYGINSFVIPYNVQVKSVSVTGVFFNGISLGIGNSTVVEGCTVNMVGGFGIYADSVSDSTTVNCGTGGILAVTAQNCKGQCVGSGTGLIAKTANDCYGRSSSGTGLDADSANNCYGISLSSYGLSASTANNCYGYSSGSGYAGLYASYLAQNCYGFIVGQGYGINAIVAQNCYGESGANGFGIYTRTATGCYGKSTSAGGVGLFAGTATSCAGEETAGGIAIQATIGNSCVLYSGTFSLTYKYNMP